MALQCAVYDPRSYEMIEPIYRLEWPEGVVITKPSLTKYCAIHRMLFLLNMPSRLRATWQNEEQPWSGPRWAHALRHRSQQIICFFADTHE